MSLPQPQTAPTSKESLASRVVGWQQVHGRHTLPWQNTRDPYRVWLSEIMLQQTQVAAVLGYYTRFLKQLPDIASLAAASSDEVMSLWSGLGYYSRARNLHACAQQVVAQFGGEFPRTAALLETLPGIGRSTAAAISSFCFGERVAILDANVKRVLTRVFGFDGDLARAANERILWDRATDILPRCNLGATMPRYTQGLMDIGATICSPRAPSCIICPLQIGCVACMQGNQEAYPVKTRSLKRSAETWWLRFAYDPNGRIHMDRRPDRGVWAGLFAPPVFSDLVDLQNDLERSDLIIEATPVIHTLTHKDLTLNPVLVKREALRCQGAEVFWRMPVEWSDAGIPAPIRKMLPIVAALIPDAPSLANR